MKNQFQRVARIDHQQIAALLTQGTHHLDESIVSALDQNRALALQKQRVHAPVLSLAAGHRAHALLPHSTHQWLAAAVVFAAVIFGVTTYWPNTQDHQNLDLAILTSDQPIDAFVDK